MAIYSLQIEKHVLAGLIKHTNVFSEIVAFVTDKDFYDNIHNTIFLIIRSCFEKNEKWDKVILAEKIKNIGVTFKDDINIYDYIDSLSYIPIEYHATIDAAKELIKLRIRRDLEETSNKIKNYVAQNGNKLIDEIISDVDCIYSEKTSLYKPEDAPQNIFQSLETLVEERGNNPVEETGLATPYPEFNRLFGGLKEGNVYAVASRAGEGKSTYINDLSFKTGLSHKKCKVLICDTEMFTYDIQFRQISALSGVPTWYIETGQWRKNPEMVEKVRKALKENKEHRFYYHYHIGNKSIDQVISIMRRWYYQNVKEDEECILGYDYLKMTVGDSLGKNFQETQLIGEKTDKLKKITEQLPRSRLLTAIQLNRSAENFNRNSSDVTDDGSAIATSDRLQWFASFLGIFRCKTLDEINLDGTDFGTHKLVKIKGRFQGRDAAGHRDMVRRANEQGEFKWVNNYLNYNVNNFNIEERGSLRDIVTLENQRFQLEDNNVNDGEVL